MIPIYENIDVTLNTSLKIAAYSHSQKCKSAGWHIHPEYELVYIKNGSGKLKVGNRMEPYRQGALLFLGPNIPHSDFGNREQLDHMEVVIQFNEGFVEDKIAVFPEFRTLRNFIKKAQKVLVFNNSVKERLSTDFEELVQLSTSDRLISFMNIMSRLSEDKDHKTVLTSCVTNSWKSTDVERLEAIFEFVNAHYNEPISTEMLARKIGLTTNSFCRFFKKMANKPFIQFVNEFRTGKAVEHFNEGCFSVSEVMYKCGYTDASYFTKQFKRSHDLTPSEYMRSVA
ncbi:MAG TPA: AraC family transcriptional regulator [Eudoraea sp.]|nr:AraC family transcriptional regulator [Eudoraea sp.]